jgi:hypothetical protein
MEITMCCLLDKQKRNFLSGISDMRKSLNNHLDKIEKQTVEEMESEEHNLQGKLKKVGNGRR